MKGKESICPQMPKKPDDQPYWTLKRSRKRWRVLQATHQDWDGLAEAIWKLREQGWECMQASPAIDWIKPMMPEEAKAELTGRGWKFKWL